MGFLGFPDTENPGQYTTRSCNAFHTATETDTQPRITQPSASRLENRAVILHATETAHD